MEGQKVKVPFELCSKNLERSMYPLIVYACYYCQKTSSERESFQSPSGKMFISIPLCSKCVEFNRLSQESGRMWLAQCQKDKLINMNPDDGL